MKSHKVTSSKAAELQVTSRISGSTATSSSTDFTLSGLMSPPPKNKKQSGELEHFNSHTFNSSSKKN